MRVVFARIIGESKHNVVELANATLQSGEIPEIVEALNQRPDITVLDLDDNCIRPTRDGYKLLELKYVRVLNLKRNFIDDDFAKALVAHPNFTELNLEDNALTNDGIQALIPFAHQTELKVGCTRVTSASVVALKVKLEENRQKIKMRAEADFYLKTKAEFDNSFSGRAQTILPENISRALCVFGLLTPAPLVPKCQDDLTVKTHRPTRVELVV